MKKMDEDGLMKKDLLIKIDLWKNETVQQLIKIELTQIVHSLVLEQFHLSFLERNRKSCAI